MGEGVLDIFLDIQYLKKKIAFSESFRELCSTKVKADLGLGKLKFNS